MSLQYKNPRGQLTDCSSSMLLKELRYCRRRKYTREGIPASLLLFFFTRVFFHVSTHISKARTEYINFFGVREQPLTDYFNLYHINSYCSVTTGGEVANVNRVFALESLIFLNCKKNFFKRYLSKRG